MKILHLIDTLDLGGAQTLVKGIFEKDAGHHELYLFALRRSENRVLIDHPNIFVSRSSSRYSLSPLREIRKLIGDKGIDVLHCQLPRSMAFGYLLKRFHFPKLRLIIHEQGDIFEGSRILIWLYKMMNHRADRFIACSEATKEEIHKRTGIHKDRILRLYNFVELDRFQPETLRPLREGERKKYGHSATDFVFGFAARMIKRKGWEEFLEAALILAGNSSFKFLMAGSGEDEPKVRQRAGDSALAASVTFAGYCADMRNFYAGIDCLVVPSHWEPMGMTEIEAMAAGIPVIASNVAGLNEVVRHKENALLFEARNAKELAKAMQSIASDRELSRSLAQQASKDVQEFSCLKYLDALEKLYTELINTPAR
jgi:glycosyltransferase involved in cell wall biosynthesis